MNKISQQLKGTSETRRMPFTCAFRGKVLNKKMGGVPNSLHQKACAVDFVVKLKDQDRFMKMLQTHFKNEIDFAQNYLYRIKNGKKIARNFAHINIAESDLRKLFKTEIHKRKKIIFGSQGSSLELFKV